MIKESASLADDREKRALRESLREHVASVNFFRLGSYLLLFNKSSLLIARARGARAMHMHVFRRAFDIGLWCFVL